MYGGSLSLAFSIDTPSDLQQDHEHFLCCICIGRYSHGLNAKWCLSSSSSFFLFSLQYQYSDGSILTCHSQFSLSVPFLRSPGQSSDTPRRAELGSNNHRVLHHQR